MITFSLGADTVLAELEQIRASQIRYAMERAINQVGKSAQTAIRDGIRQDIKLRRIDFELKRIMITKFAKKKGELTLILQIDPQAVNLIRLATQEDHLAWFPYNGKNYQWVPNSDVFGNKIILRSNPLHPANLEFGFAQSDQEGPRRRAFNQHNKGNSRTFVLDHTTGKNPNVPQVWQRIASANDNGRKRHKGVIKEVKSKAEGGFMGWGKKGTIRFRNTRMLYTLVDRQKTPLKLKFYEPATAKIFDEWPQAVMAALAVAIRPRSGK